MCVDIFNPFKCDVSRPGLAHSVCTAPFLSLSVMPVFADKHQNYSYKENSLQ